MSMNREKAKMVSCAAALIVSVAAAAKPFGTQGLVSFTYGGGRSEFFYSS